MFIKLIYDVITLCLPVSSGLESGLTTKFIHLSTYPYIYLFIHLSTYSSIHLSIYPSFHLFIHTPIYSSTHPPTHPYIYLFIHLSIYPSIHLSFHLSIHPSNYPLNCSGLKSHYSTAQLQL